MYMENITSFFNISKKILTVFSLVLFCLLAYNGSAIFFIHVPFPSKYPESFSPENVAGETRMFSSAPPSTKLPSAVQYSVKDENPRVKLNTHLHLLHKDQNLVIHANRTKLYHPKRRKMHQRRVVNIIGYSVSAKQFEARVRMFLHSSCEFRFFMTWISPVESFGERESLCVESLFKSHPNGCLIIVSYSLDSTSGTDILRRFTEKGFKVTAISPDFNYLFKNTHAQAWYNQLKRGNINPGEISLGQNLSNLLRICLLYRFGGIYIDTDIIVLKSFGQLKNAIGAQTVDLRTGNWSRLNNAVMIFDQGHPLLSKFIEEFALTFDGNKWGHNGPYLVSRVVSRLSGRFGYGDLTVLPPAAFYLVDWAKIGSLFEGPNSLAHSKWLVAKLRQIQKQSYGVHLWNKQSRMLRVEKGSIIQHIMLSSKVVGNSSSLAVLE